MVSMLSLTNESHIKLDLFIPDIKERREKNVLKLAKNNLPIKPDIYEHNSEKQLKICGLHQFKMYGKNTSGKRGKTNKVKYIDILKSLFI